MLTKLIVLVIILNLVGSFLKRHQEKKRKQEMMANSGVPEAAPLQPQPQTPANENYNSDTASSDAPDDLFAALMGKWEEPVKDQPAEYNAPIENQVAYKEPSNNVASQSSETSVTEEVPVFGVEYEKISTGKSMVDYMEEAKIKPRYLIEPEPPPISTAQNTLPDEKYTVSQIATVTKDPTMGPLRLFSKGGLRQAVIYHEVLGTPKGLI